MIMIYKNINNKNNKYKFNKNKNNKNNKYYHIHIKNIQ